MHTEKEYRRLGLGMKLSAKLFREEMGRFWEDGEEDGERESGRHGVRGSERER